MTKEVEGMLRQNKIFAQLYPNVFARCHAIAKDLRKKTDSEYRQYFNAVMEYDREKFKENFGTLRR